MKTYRSTLNRYLATCIALVAASFAVLNLDNLEPYREAAAQALSLPTHFLWLPICVLSLVAIYLLFQRLRSKLARPLKAIADQCADGKLLATSSSEYTREIRIIREYIRQSQERAERRARQIEKMERELFATRKERDRSLLKNDEFEDIIASYSRIRKELTLDNTKLRRHSANLSERIGTLEKQLASSDEPAPKLADPKLHDLRSTAEDIRTLSDQLALNGDQRSISSIRDSLKTIAQKGELQLAQIDTLGDALSSFADRAHVHSHSKHDHGSGKDSDIQR